MAEEHGYNRSEKKCRKKFENLHKYFKTKEGKAGKRYRFFRQLAALYGETSTNQNSISESAYRTPIQENQQAFHHEQKLSDQSISFSNTSEFETASSENKNDEDLSAIAFMMSQKSMVNHNKMKDSQSRKRVKRSKWKGEIKEFVDAQMMKLMESQEAWMERMLKTIEDREQERLYKEEERMKQEMARFDKVRKFWARERAWVEARDNVLMETLKKIAGRNEPLVVSSSLIMPDTSVKNEPASLNLKQMITCLEPKFEQSGYSDESVWEEIEAKMASIGYNMTAKEFKEKWENMQRDYDHHEHVEIAKQRLERMELLFPSNNSYAESQGHDSYSTFCR